jgi:Flp pilus assembly protein TadD
VTPLLLSSHRTGLLAASVLLAVLTGCSGAQKGSDDWFDGGPMQQPSAETLQLTARILAAKGRTDQAGFILERLLREHPDHLGTYTEGAEVLLIEGRVAEAIAWLDRGLARFPSQPILLNDRGMCHLLSADLRAATADFEAAYAADPADADFVANLALVRALAGDEQEAALLWGRVVPPSTVQVNLSIAREARPRFAAGTP